MAPEEDRAEAGSGGDGAPSGRRKGSEPGNSDPSATLPSVSSPPPVTGGTPQAAADANNRGVVGASDGPSQRMARSSVPTHAREAVAGVGSEDAGAVSRSRDEPAAEARGSSGAGSRAPSDPSPLPAARSTPVYVGDLKMAEIRLKRVQGKGNKLEEASAMAEVKALEKAVEARRKAALLPAMPMPAAKEGRPVKKARFEKVGRQRFGLPCKAPSAPTKKRKAIASHALGTVSGLAAPQPAKVRRVGASVPAAAVLLPVPAVVAPQPEAVVVPAPSGASGTRRFRLTAPRPPRQVARPRLARVARNGFDFLGAGSRRRRRRRRRYPRRGWLAHLPSFDPHRVKASVGKGRKGDKVRKEGKGKKGKKEGEGEEGGDRMDLGE